MTRQKYRLTFTFVDTEYQAQGFCERYNSDLTPYEKRRDYVATYTPWESKEGNKRFICWHYYKA